MASIGAFKLTTLAQAIADIVVPTLNLATEYFVYNHYAKPKLGAFQMSGDLDFVDLQGNHPLGMATSWNKVTVNPAGTLMVYSNYLYPAIVVYEKIGSDWVYSQTLDETGTCHGVQFSPDGNYLVTSPLKCYSVSGNVLTQLTLTSISGDPAVPSSTIYDIAWAPDSSKFVAVGGTTPYVFLYHVSGTTVERQFQPTPTSSGAAYCVTWHPDGTKFFVGSSVTPFYMIYTYSAGNWTGSGTTGFGITANPQSAKYSPDGTRLILLNSVSPYVHYWTVSGATHTKQTITMATSPGSQAYAVDWMGDSSTIGIASYGTTPYVFFYTISGNTFTKTANPAVVPYSAGALGISWSSADNSAYVLSNNQPYVFIYSRSGSTFTYSSTFQAPQMIPSGANWPAAAGGQSYAASINNTASYIGVSMSSSPYVKFYTFSPSTKIATATTQPGTLPTSAGTAISWHPTSNIAAIGHTSTPYLSVYSLSGSTATKLTNPTVLPAGSATVVKWNHNGTSLIVCYTTTYKIYNFNGSTFTDITAGITTLPAVGTISDASWVYDGTNTSLVFTGTTSPYIAIYNRSGDTFTKLTNPTTLPINGADQAAWSPDGTKLALSVGTSGKGFMVYSRSGNTFTKLADPAYIQTSAANLICFNTTGEVLSVYYRTKNILDNYIVQGNTLIYKNSVRMLVTDTSSGSFDELKWVKP
jgi:hypothetical protein